MQIFVVFFATVGVASAAARCSLQVSIGVAMCHVTRKRSPLRCRSGCGVCPIVSLFVVNKLHEARLLLLAFQVVTPGPGVGAQAYLYQTVTPAARRVSSVYFEGTRVQPLTENKHTTHTGHSCEHSSSFEPEGMLTRGHTSAGVAVLGPNRGPDNGIKL